VLFSGLFDLLSEFIALRSLAIEFFLGSNGFVLMPAARFFEHLYQRMELLVFLDELVDVLLDIVANAMDVVFVAALFFFHRGVTLDSSIGLSFSVDCGWNSSTLSSQPQRKSNA
jgi:hypothetical protein